MQAKQEIQQLAGALILSDLTKNPPFLTRNIDQRFTCENDKRPKPKIARLNRGTFDLRAAVHLTSMNERLSPRLKVSVTGIAPGKRRSDGSSYNVVRGRGNAIDVRCRLKLKIYSVRNPDSSLFETHRIFNMHGGRQADGKVTLALTMALGERPFEIRMDELEQIVKHGIEWREVMAEQYSIRFQIEFPRAAADVKRVWQVLDLPDPGEAPGDLWAKWTKLPRCPEAKDYLPLFVGQDISTKYALNVHMGWGTEEWLPKTLSKRPGTPLECLTALKRQRSNAQLLTPASTPRSHGSEASTDIVIRYHANGSVITKNGYHCLLNRCKPRNLGSLARLEHHLAHNHPSLEFDVELDEDMSPGESHIDIRITTGSVDLLNTRASKSRGRNASEKADSVIEDFDWSSPVAPNTPLNLRQIKQNPEKFRLGENRARVREPAHTPVLAAPTFAPAAEIKLELPERLRQRKAVVPHPKSHNNVAFISSDNKAELVTGELLSDEDDGVDEAHLLLARKMQMMESIPDLTARKFLHDINAHLESEGASADKYLGPALRRWLHKRQDWLGDARIAKMFEDLVFAAYGKGYVSAEVYKTCMAVSQEVRNEHASRHAGRPQSRSESQITKRHKDTCSCGSTITSVRDRVICSNKVSLRVSPVSNSS